MLGDDDLVRDVGLPGSEDDDDMLAFVNVRDGGRRELSFSFFAANEFNLSVLIDFEFLFDGRGWSRGSRCIFVLVRTNFHSECAPVGSDISHSSVSRMKLLLAAARLGRGSKSGQGNYYA